MSSINKLYIHVPTPEISRKVQQILFEHGCIWPVGNTKLQYTKMKYLVVKGDNLINFNNDEEDAKKQSKHSQNLEINCSWMENIED